MYKKSPITVDVNWAAHQIIMKHTNGIMSCGNPEFDNNMDLWTFMLSECANILTEEFLEGKYNPMEYNAIRNEIASIINGIFSPIT